MTETRDRIVQIEPVQWVALTMAMVSKEFSERLCREVGFRAFEGAGLTHDVFDQLENFDCDAWGLGRQRIMDLLGVKWSPGHKLSNAILSVLKEEARIGYSARQAGRARKLSLVIRNATAELMRMARQDRLPTCPEEMAPMPGPEYFI